jgi:aminoglycoside/choline kinase family phosphotransferase
VVRGPVAYDLVSLLQDARVDVPPALEAVLFEHYCAAVAAREPAFDREAFAFAYAALGAQRNTKILGIFARLARRDAKPGYLKHVPRIWGYLARDLEHPRLEALKRWYDLHFPPPLRSVSTLERRRRMMQRTRQATVPAGVPGARWCLPPGSASACGR